MNRTFWRGRRVFLTGHTGFKGSWLALWLQKLGAAVTGFALDPPTDPSLFEVAGVERGMRSLIGDVRDSEGLSSALRSARPEIVIHMAAQALVRKSYSDPIETYSTNVMGLVHLLEAVRRSPQVRAVLVVTSDKCYENREWAWGYRENDALGGYDPYSSSKGCAEIVTAAFRRSYFNPDGSGGHDAAIASARAGNVVGGGDWAQDRLVPDILRAFENGIAVRIRKPKSVRPWQHVLEPISGYLLLAERLYANGPDFAESWNFGADEADARPVEWIASRMSAAWGEGATWEADRAEHPHEASLLKLDCSKARRQLGWAPRWGLSKTIDRIVSWHKCHRAGADMRAVTLGQIAEFEAS